MKKLLTILFLLAACIVQAQYTPNSGAYQYKGLKQINSLQPPTNTGLPVTNINAPDSNYSALFYNKTDTSWYQFNPVSKVWSKFQGNINDFLQDGLIQPGYVTWSAAGLTFDVTGAVYRINSTIYNSAAGQITLDAADPDNPRYDVIAVDNTGTIVNITGVAGANPTIPQIDPATQVYLTAIYLPAGATTPGITQELIYDENTENFTGTTSGITLNLDNTTNPYHLTKSANVGSSTATRNIDFTKNTGTLNAADYTILKLYLWLKQPIPSAANIRISFLNGTTVVSNVITLGAATGFTKTLDSNWQNISIPISSFHFTNSNFNKVRITFTGSQSGNYFDYIQLQAGIAPPDAGNPFVTNYAKNAGNDSTILSLSNGQRFAASDNSGSSGIDSIFISSTDSIFIITSNNDTIYVGTNNSPRDTAHLTPGFGLLGTDFYYAPNGLPYGLRVDTNEIKTFINQVVTNGGDTSIYFDSSNITWLVDSVINDPFSAPNGNKYLILAPTSGEFIGHENQIATRVGSSWTYETPTAGQILQATNPIITFYKFDGTNWILTRRAASIGGDQIAGDYQLGNKAYNSTSLITNGINRLTITPDGKIQAPDLATAYEHPYLYPYGANGEIRVDTFHTPVAGTNITIHGDTINATGATGAASAFTDLTDVPSSYSGAANKLLRVNGTATGLEFFTSPYVLYADTATMLSTYLRSNVAAATYVPLTRTITINGTTLDLSANRSWTTPGAALTTSYVGFGDGSNILTGSSNFVYNTANAFLGIGGTTPTARLHLSGNISAANWSTSGIGIRQDAATYTNSTSSGTVAVGALNSFFGGTFASTSATTYTEAATIYIPTAPAQGTNVSITASNSYGIYCVPASKFTGTANFAGAVNLNGITTAVSITSTGKMITGGTMNSPGPGFDNAFRITPTISQTSSAGYRALWISPFENTLGSGSRFLIDAGTNTAANVGGTHTTKFSVDYSGSTLIGGATADASAILNAASTTQGFLPPRMTTTQRNAISSPAEGLIVYDLTLHKGFEWDGTTWQAFW